jgi:hypothetical protein
MSKTMPISEVTTRASTRIGLSLSERKKLLLGARKARGGFNEYGKYERLKDSLEVLSDSDLMKQIRRNKGFYAKRKQGIFSRPSLASLIPQAAGPVIAVLAVYQPEIPPHNLSLLPF